jgi:hypothetical protein
MTMMGDHITIKVKNFRILESIARLAAYLSFEVDKYIILGMAVEEFIKNQSNDDFQAMCEAHHDCYDSASTFMTAREQQLIRLVANKNLRAVEIEQTESAPTPQAPESPETPKPDNIVRLFGRPPVDKKD